MEKGPAWVVMVVMLSRACWWPRRAVQPAPPAPKASAFVQPEDCSLEVRGGRDSSALSPQDTSSMTPFTYFLKKKIATTNDFFSQDTYFIP